MKNIVTITSQNGICECTCCASTYDGTNSLYIETNVEDKSNPKLEVYLNDSLVQTIVLEANSNNLVAIGSEYFSSNGVLKIRYIDDNYVGSFFTFNFPTSLAGNMTVRKSEDYTFNVQFTMSSSSGGGSSEATTVSVRVNSTNTIATDQPARVVNVGNDVNVALDFYIPSGKDGKDGNDGDDGISVESIDVVYYKSTSPNELIDGEWLSDAPTWESGAYIWTKTITTFSDNSKFESKPVCISGAKGESGLGVSIIVEQYYLSTSKTTLSGGTWSLTPPVWTSGKYIWTRSAITWSDNTTTYSTEQLASALNSANELATTAKQTADGKNVVFYQATQPSTTGRNKGDLWFDTDDGNKMYCFNGAVWTASPYGTNAIESGAITTAHLVSNAITADKIASKAITADKINVDDLFAQDIEATGSITGATLVSKYDTEQVVIENSQMTFFTEDRRGEGGLLEIGSLSPMSRGEIYGSGGWCFDSVGTFAGADLDYVASQIPKLISVRYSLKNISWVKSGSGMYYAYSDLTSRGVKKVLAVSAGDWSNLRTTDIVTFSSLGSSKILINSTTNSFDNTSFMDAQVLYI